MFNRRRRACRWKTFEAVNFDSRRSLLGCESIVGWVKSDSDADSTTRALPVTHGGSARLRISLVHPTKETHSLSANERPSNDRSVWIA